MCSSDLSARRRETAVDAQERDPLVLRKLARRQAGSEQGTGIMVRYQGLVRYWRDDNEILVR